MTGGHAGRVGAWAAWTAVAAAVGAGCALLEGDGAGGTEIARGEELYEANCAECHGGATGGEMTDLPPPHNAQGHTWHHGDCEIVEWTLEGRMARPGLPADVEPMPAFGDELDEADARAILAYIKTWWTPGQREHQAQVTEQVCDA